MVDRSEITGDVILIADRGYESYNNMAHIQEKGWKYLIRIKDFQQYNSGILHGFELPNQEEFDIDINLTVTRKQTNKIKELTERQKPIIARLPIAKHLITSQKPAGKPIRQSCMQSHFALSVSSIRECI